MSANANAKAVGRDFAERLLYVNKALIDDVRDGARLKKKEIRAHLKRSPLFAYAGDEVFVDAMTRSANERLDEIADLAEKAESRKDAEQAAAKKVRRSEKTAWAVEVFERGSWRTIEGGMTKRLAKAAAKELAGLGSRIAIAEYTASDCAIIYARQEGALSRIRIGMLPSRSSVFNPEFRIGTTFRRLPSIENASPRRIDRCTVRIHVHIHAAVAAVLAVLHESAQRASSAPATKHAPHPMMNPPRSFPAHAA